MDTFLWNVEIFTVSCFLLGFLRKAGNDRRINKDKKLRFFLQWDHSFSAYAKFSEKLRFLTS